MSRTLILYHGSPNIVGRPRLGMGSKHRDFGSGFYCTRSKELAGEWACPSGLGGYINEYALDTTGLRILDLKKTERPILSWLALLASNRTFRTDSDLSLRAIEYLIENYGVDPSGYDVIRGYRGDDSYFSFATDFINNSVPLGRLSSSMELGRDGEQYVLVSERAISGLRYMASEPADSYECFRRRCERDLRARIGYLGRDRVESVDGYDVMIEDMVLGRTGP